MGLSYYYCFMDAGVMHGELWPDERDDLMESKII